MTDGFYIFLAFYIWPCIIYVPIYLYRNRVTYFVEGLSWPPLRLVTGFYIGMFRSLFWPYFLISYVVNSNKSKKETVKETDKSEDIIDKKKTGKFRKFIYIILGLSVLFYLYYDGRLFNKKVPSSVVNEINIQIKSSSSYAVILSDVHNGSKWHIEEIIIEMRDKGTNQFGDKFEGKKYLIKTNLKPFESKGNIQIATLEKYNSDEHEYLTISATGHRTPSLADLF